MKMTRRQFLKTGSAALAASSLAGIGSTLASFQARAMPGSGYKALVCLFLYGGMDNHDTIIPYDNPGYQRWSQIRASLLEYCGLDAELMHGILEELRRLAGAA